MLKSFACAIATVIAISPVVQAATVVSAGSVVVSETTGLSLTGTLGLDLTGLDANRVGPYRIRTRVETTSDFLIETTNPFFGAQPPVTFGPTVFVNSTTVTGPIALSDALAFDIAGALGAGGPLSLGDAFGAISGGTTGTTVLFGFTVGYDFSAIGPTMAGFDGPFSVTIPASEGPLLLADIRQAIIVNAEPINAFLATLVPPLQVPQDPALDFIDDLKGFSFDYAVSVDVHPVPLPATLPMLVLAMGGTAAWQSRRRGVARRQRAL